MALKAAREKTGREDFTWGAEMVLTKETASELPKVIRWLAERGGKFLLVTHIMPYDGDALPLVAYDPNVDKTLDIYRERKKEAAEEGLDLSLYYIAKWRLRPLPRRQEIIDFMEGVVREISRKGLPQHMFNLAAHDEERFSALEGLFERSARLAEELGVALRLPSYAKVRAAVRLRGGGERLRFRLGDGPPLLLPVALLHKQGRREDPPRRGPVLRLGDRAAAARDLERPQVRRLPQGDLRLRLPLLRKLQPGALRLYRAGRFRAGLPGEQTFLRRLPMGPGRAAVHEVE